MSLANDYFLLYHGKEFKNDIKFTILKDKHDKVSDDFFYILSLILSITRKNYDKIFSLNSFTILLKIITNQDIKSLQDLNILQYCLIENISSKIQKNEITKLHNAFEYLKNRKILLESNYDKLISLFDPKELNVYQEIDFKDELNIENTLGFQDTKKELEYLILELKDLFSSQNYIKDLKQTYKYLNNQKFSIGITGVMNAGKSTLLNALMGQELLGSSVVPETANLTIIKYAKKQSAKVFYWNKEQWAKIEKNAKNISSIQEFVKETKEIFKNNLDSIIQEESYCEDIDIYNLSSYTSAKNSNKKCNLVKYIELESNLSFLSNGIEIVDTPGLDDPVIQREEITKEYIAKCDLLLHLMNVSQSATLKDVEFIIDAILYQNITKLLIVITRADSVSKKELKEVISYTKSSIKAQLQASNKDNKLDFILQSIKFIPISGKMALYHRIGKSQEAINLGYPLEETGILDIEEYLNETLFSKTSSKCDLIIKSSKTKISKIIKKELDSLHYELILLAKNKEELKQNLIDFEEDKNKKNKIFANMNRDITVYKLDCEEYVIKLQTFLDNELIDLQNIIKQRVFSDVRYSFEKTKQKPKASRIRIIIQTAINDGIIDIIRDFRYKFIKKSQNIGEICEQKYQEYGFTLGHKNDNFDALSFFQDDLKNGFLTSSNEVLISKIIYEVSKSKSKALNEFDLKIQVCIKDEFKNIDSHVKTKANTLSMLLIKKFFNKLAEPLKTFEEQVLNDEQILQKQLDLFDNNEINKETLKLKVHQKIKKLEVINTGLLL